MRCESWGKALWGALLGLGCSGPALDLPSHAAPSGSVELEPSVGEQGVPLLFRAHVLSAPLVGEPWLFRGELSDYYERAVKKGELPTALRDRAVPLRFWREGPDEWLQPLTFLEPDATYALAQTGTGTLRVVHAQATSEPRARRVFPPAGSPKHNVAVICGTTRAALPSELLLAPGELGLAASPSDVAGAGCVLLTAQGVLTEPAVAPPLVAGTLLDPAPWLPLAAALPKAALTCTVGRPFHGGCLEVLDDRLLLRGASDDLLLTLSAPVATTLITPKGSRGLLLRGLEPETGVELRGTLLSGAGETTSFAETVTTLAARRHLVLNEVLANPLGPEPAGEWIELVNDSETPTSLADVWLEDSGGHAPLPDVELAPGELALLVPPDFRVSGLDVPIPEGVRLLELSSLGAHGLTNGGEVLLLIGREGVLSRFPLVAATHGGVSIARRSLSGADDDARNFAEQRAPGASPGAPNVFEDEVAAPSE